MEIHHYNRSSERSVQDEAERLHAEYLMILHTSGIENASKKRREILARIEGL